MCFRKAVANGKNAAAGTPVQVAAYYKELKFSNVRHSSAPGPGSLIKVPVAGFDSWREPTPLIVSPLASHVHHGMGKHNTQQKDCFKKS